MSLLIRYDSQTANGLPTRRHLMGLCEALARNYLNNVGKGKKIMEPVVSEEWLLVCDTI